jgi:hypothetical protein
MGARDDGRFAVVFLAIEGDDALNADAQTSAYGRRRSASPMHHLPRLAIAISPSPTRAPGPAAAIPASRASLAGGPLRRRKMEGGLEVAADRKPPESPAWGRRRRSGSLFPFLILKSPRST